MAFNSDEVNLLVYRYLEESGFRHSAFTFGYESSVLNAGLDSMSIPRGALMSLLQKGVLFAEAEVFSLLTDGELDSRFEKAIGCMTILECDIPTCYTMCDSAKTKALSRRIMVATTSSATSNIQQQKQQGQINDQQTSQQQRRTPSRLTPLTQVATTSASDQQHQSIITPTTSSTVSSANSFIQNHAKGYKLSKITNSNQTSRSNEFNLSNKQQITSNQQINRDRNDFSINSCVVGRNFQQQHQNANNPSSPSPHSLNYPPRASSSSSVSLQTFRGGGVASSHQQQLQNNDRLCQAVEQVASSNQSTSSTVVTVANHLHPGTAATSLMNVHHPFYQQQHAFKQHTATTLTATSSFLPTTGIQISNGAINGPSSSVSFPTSLSSSNLLSTQQHQHHHLHPHQTTSHNVLGTSNLSQQQTAEMTRLMLNGGNNAAAVAAAAFNMVATSGGSSISHSLKRNAGGNG
ncbi:LisH domain-containing protein [Meloidogyne graminicola]|uniref:LisH domain-containing protein n=1 Tax=Meloidogyne graminicola TaxID=189291 RepID=A0A8S9ZZK8_9BILA|nr:LisH domain-containing protein [Meloidogyne graminicola]